jgi:hypothetical protein
MFAAFGAAIAAAQEPKPNAALQYWQAFALLPNSDKDDAKLIEEWNKTPLNDAVKNLVRNGRASLMFLNRAARIEHCDWGMNLNDGPHLFLPHISKARELARLAGLYSRVEIAEGRWDSAVQAFVDVMSMARHMSSDFTLISKLVRYNIESTAIEALAPSLPKLKAEQLAKVAAALDAPVGGSVMADVVRGEKKYMVEWLIQKLKDAEAAKKGSWREFLHSVLDFNEGKEFAKNARDIESVMKMLEDMKPAYDELAKLVELPAAEFDRQYPAFANQLRRENAGFRLLMPAMEKAVEAQRRNQVQRALFRAGIEVVQGGAGKVEQTKDPFGDGPFAYRPVEGGFQLTSKFQYKGESVKIVIGGTQP